MQWANRARRSSRRFTTIEGWKEVGQGVYAAAGSGIRTLTINPEFDTEQYHNDYLDWTRPAKTNIPGSYSEDANGRVPTQREACTTKSLPPTPIEEETYFSEGTASTEQTSKSPQEQPELSYHIFSKKQKWMLVWLIGVAGLFSGLSSNIYFPSLDAIARVGLYFTRHNPKDSF